MIAIHDDDYSFVAAALRQLHPVHRPVFAQRVYEACTPFPIPVPVTSTAPCGWRCGDLGAAARSDPAVAVVAMTQVTAAGGYWPGLTPRGRI
jgi:hypothetical protein